MLYLKFFITFLCSAFILLPLKIPSFQQISLSCLVDDNKIPIIDISSLSSDKKSKTLTFHYCWLLLKKLKSALLSNKYFFFLSLFLLFCLSLYIIFIFNSIYRKKYLLKSDENIKNTNPFANPAIFSENLSSQYINNNNILPNSSDKFLSQHKNSDLIQNNSDNLVLQDNTDNIVDELVKIIVHKDDLILMPGVPELPGLECYFESTGSKNKSPYYNFNTYKNNTFPSAQNLHHQVDVQEADDIILKQKNLFFNSLSPISENKNKPDININPDIYDILIENFKNSIKNIIPDFNPSINIEIIDCFAIDDKHGFNLVKYADKSFLFGNLNSKTFLIKTFLLNELNDEPLFMDLCTKTRSYSTYSVILNKYKALIKVSLNEISLIGEYK